MRLTDAVRGLNTCETGTVLVDASGSVVATLRSAGPDGGTAELEILRRDLARVLLDDLSDTVEIVYGDTIAAVDDLDDTGQVTASSHSGRIWRADLLVIAERRPIHDPGPGVRRQGRPPPSRHHDGLRDDPRIGRR